jgi:hypothetical protein
VQTHQTPAGWFRDPSNPTQLRWWDGGQWSSNLWPVQSVSGGYPSTPPPAYPPSAVYGYFAPPEANRPYGDSRPNPTEKWLLPVGRSGLAVAAGYLGLFSLVGLFAPISIVVSILALRDLKKRPGLLGQGRAVFGLVMGILFTALMIIGIASDLSH